jgi:formylglycine-generating enzyme
MAEIFISYAREDIGTARRLATELETRGWSVFWDRRIPAGRRFAEVIARQLEAAKCVIALWSTAANTSDWVLDEAAEALERNILAPARIEAVKPPMGFRRIHAADLIGWQGDGTHEGFRQLLDDIAQYVPPSRAAEVRQIARPEPSTGDVRINPDDGQPYVWIPPGEFQMGCSPGDDQCFDHEKPQHTVRITRGFWLGQTPVTVGAYKQFAERTGISMPGEPVIGQRKLNPQWSDLEQPMVAVTWTDAKSYCESWAKGRLPTEAEWEYAARAGSTASRYGKLDEIAWYADNSGNERLDSTRAWDKDAGGDLTKYFSLLEKDGNRIPRVKQKQPNSWGLHDMLGNVWEWMADWYDENYYQTLPSPATDPKGPSSGTERVARGGSWDFSPGDVRASYRVRNGPESWNSVVGFRCVREVIP